MQKGILKYGALVTKLRAMSGNLLKKEDYISLAKQPTVTDAVTYIKVKTAYGRELQGPVEEIHRDTLERRLKYVFFEEFAKLSKFLTPADKEFAMQIMARYEVAFLKLVIRNCFAGNARGNGFIFDFPQEVKEMMSFDAEKVLDAGSMEELLDVIKNTKYAQTIGALYARGRTPTLFEIETNLDIFYFTSLQRDVDSCLKGDTAKAMKRVVGTEADIMNVLWIYRCKKYYKLANEHIYALLLPVYYDLTPSKIKAMVECADFDEFYEHISHTKYFKYFEMEDHYIFEKKHGFKLYKNEYNCGDLQFYMPLFYPTKINRFNKFS